jgi:hypothetical protein
LPNDSGDKDKPFTGYKILNGEEIQGTFYQPELQKVSMSDTDLFKVEKMVKTRGKGPSKQYFIKLLYWSEKFPSWVNAPSLSTIHV